MKVVIEEKRVAAHLHQEEPCQATGGGLHKEQWSGIAIGSVLPAP